MQHVNASREWQINDAVVGVVESMQLSICKLRWLVKNRSGLLVRLK